MRKQNILKVKHSMDDNKIFVAITGASGSVYGQTLIKELLSQVNRIYLCLSETAKKVVEHELTANSSQIFSLLKIIKDGPRNPQEKKILRVFDCKNFFAPIASGSSAPTAMVILPCSMGTLARIRMGISSNLIERAADVCLKQKRPLIICPRETPLNTIHLENMYQLSQMGAQIIPCMPGFYNHPKTIDDLVNFLVGRILEALNLKHQLYQPWNQRMR
jgi:flavin prenyltransferase